MATVWSEDPSLETRLREFMDEGYGCRRIAALLGLSKDQVQKKMQRIKAAEDAEDREEQPEETLPYEITPSYAKYQYTFDGETFTFPVNNELVRFPKDRWEEIVAAYSGAGGNATQYEVALRFGIPKKVLERCLTLYQHYKARPPLTREQIKDAADAGDYEPLVEQAIEVAEHAFFGKYEAARLKQALRENQELKKFALDHQAQIRAVRDAVAEMASLVPASRPVRKNAKRSGGRGYWLHLPLFDVHFGRTVLAAMGWSEKDYGTREAADYVRLIAAAVVEYIEQQPGECLGVYLTNGGDVFHAMMQRTKKGTLLERDMPDRLVMRLALEAFIDAINTLRAAVPLVHFLLVPGNHDHVFAEFLLEFLAVHFDGSDDVVVHNTLGKRDYFLIGETGHVLDHGEGLNSLNNQALLTAERVARKVMGTDYHKASRIYYYIGHTHHREVKGSGRHLEIIRCPTIAYPDDHEEQGGWDHAPEIDFFRLDESGRVKGRETLDMNEEAAAKAA
jgi:hypothetical protein